ncbi:MAG TPA: endolytic transglycosylase MltG [Pseudonocardia sp.]
MLVQVHAGDSTKAIGAELTTLDVVRSPRAFTNAAADNEERARAVQPGYYRLRLRMSGADAVGLLLDPRSRVGQLEIKGGVQLDDTRGPDGVTTPGVLTLLSKATCTSLNGASTCISPEQLRQAMATTTPSQLGVPEWAQAGVAKADPRRRLEGLLAPGRYDIRPGSNAQDALRTVVSSSASQYEAMGVASATGKYSPYQLLIIASLVEKEGITPDFGKIAQVIFNRLGQRVRLELDSTVNYPLDLQAVRTSSTDRGKAGAYNSYLNYGLPPTPIGAPGQRAVRATLDPEKGPWMFFVRCQRDGTSCFATTLGAHEDNVRDAVRVGAF